MARANIINILGIGKLKWTGMGGFNSDDHYTTTVGKNLIEEMESLGTIWKTTDDLSLFPRKTITVIQVYAPTTNAKVTEVDQFHKNLQ